MKLLYKPYSIISKIIAAKAGQKVFSAVWGRFSKAPKPSPKAPEADLGKVAISSALEGATLAATAAVVTQLSLRLFRHLFGVWPEKPKHPAEAENAALAQTPVVVQEPPAAATPGLGTRLRRALPGAASARE